ncbi:MAG: ArsA family ATPase, partial [Halobacteriaceae archaeon]
NLTCIPSGPIPPNPSELLGSQRMQSVLATLAESFDRIIIDTAPTGHTLRLLELPKLLDTLMGRLLQFREKMSGVIGDLNPASDGSAEGFDLEATRERMNRLQGILKDPGQTDFRLVMMPEKLSVSETKRLESRLDEFGIPVKTVVVNRVMESFTEIAGVERSQFIAPNPDHCEFCQRRWQVQREALEEAHSIFQGKEIQQVPLFAESVQGKDMLSAVGTCLG